MDQVMPDYIGVEAVQEQALGLHVTIITTSGYKWISNAPCVWWRLPLKDDKTRVNGLRNITSDTVKMARILPIMRRTAIER